MTDQRIRLGFNIDHYATLRNARGGRHPDPVRAAQAAIAAGADGITCHLREARRHIRDADARAAAESALGHRFDDPDLLNSALIHSSSADSAARCSRACVSTMSRNPAMSTIS